MNQQTLSKTTAKKVHAGYMLLQANERKVAEQVKVVEEKVASKEGKLVSRQDYSGSKYGNKAIVKVQGVYMIVEIAKHLDNGKVQVMDNAPALKSHTSLQEIKGDLYSMNMKALRK